MNLLFRHCSCCRERDPNDATEIVVPERADVVAEAPSPSTPMPAETPKNNAEDQVPLIIGGKGKAASRERKPEPVPQAKLGKKHLNFLSAAKKEQLKQQVKKFVKTATTKGLTVSWLLQNGTLIPAVFKMDASLIDFTLTSTTDLLGVMARVLYSSCSTNSERISTGECEYALRIVCDVDALEGSGEYLARDQIILVFDKESERTKFWSCIQVVRVLSEKRNAWKD